MPSFAHLGCLWLWLTSGIASANDLAAVAVIIQHVMLGSDLTTRWLRESKIKNEVQVRCHTNLIWELTWLEPHVAIIVVA